MKIKLTHPLISCICITDNRPMMLLKAIYNFDSQDYPNRELVISYPEGDKKTEDILLRLLSAPSPMSIKPLKRDKSYTLGKARNHAIANCNGDYICTWDDDDLHHYRRIKDQFNAMQGNYYQAGVLSSIALYDAMTGNGFFSPPDNWPGTLICKKDLILKYPYEDNNIREWSNMLNTLDKMNFLLEVTYAPYAYTYVYHQENATAYSDFLNILYKAKKLDNQTSAFLREEFEMTINF